MPTKVFIYNLSKSFLAHVPYLRAVLLYNNSSLISRLFKLWFPGNPCLNFHFPRPPLSPSPTFSQYWLIGNKCVTFYIYPLKIYIWVERKIEAALWLLKGLFIIYLLLKTELLIFDNHWRKVQIPQKVMTHFNLMGRVWQFFLTISAAYFTNKRKVKKNYYFLMGLHF